MSESVAKRWETSATIAPDVDWFGADLAPVGVAQITADKSTVKHTLQIMVPISTEVNVQLKNNALVKVFDLNEGVALVANAGYQFDLILERGDTYNIQHKIGTQNIAALVSQALNSDI